MDEQRYQPMPSIDQLPGWLWHRTGRRARFGLALVLVAALAFTAILVPAIRRDQRAHAAAERHAEAARHAASVAALIREQRPRFGRSTASQRPAMLRDLGSAIVADARARRLDGPVLHARCEPFPKTVGEPPPELDPRKAAGSYSCVAVTSEIGRSAASSGGEIGHLYRASLDFTTGRFALCKVAGRPDPVPDPEVTTPRACAGGRLPAP
ncbi:hypothetical protein OM076_37760 [Solirubrobacter ginsenosidimutans]|uniref:Uncharacterized protein n=1 Tax=Solirubrobacter ginsenosidimutans TaxID=490573 RepID=A0A9X3N3H3_9ACTN|nr:hypothetical protein [Solirubrobacter ginsenosidimutans]MDA0166072.1 hypothetical protein [Solirubrobacter ginsenosidimutans]